MNIKKQLFLLLLFTAFLGRSAWAQTEGSATNESDDVLLEMDNPKKRSSMIAIDSVGLSFFGKELSEKLRTTKQLSVHKLSHYLSPDSKRDEVLEGFTILDTKQISAATQKQIAKLLTSTTPYILDKDIKNLCLFLPDMGIELAAKDQKVNALISLDCKMVRFYMDGATLDNPFAEFNLKQTNTSFDEVFEELFSNSTAKNDSFNDDNALAMGKSANVLIYKVKPGQGIYQVAQSASKTFNRKISPSDVCRLNQFDMDKTVLKIGQEVIVGYIN